MRGCRTPEHICTSRRDREEDGVNVLEPQLTGLIEKRSTSRCPFWAAMKSAVALLPALEFTRAPAWIRVLITATWPLEAALCRGVSPTLVFRPTCKMCRAMLQTEFKADLQTLNSTLKQPLPMHCNNSQRTLRSLLMVSQIAIAETPEVSWRVANLSTGLEQPVDCLDVAIERSLMQGRPVIIGERIHVSASGQQPVHHAERACGTC
jgi:hypothetical protein